MAKEIILSLIIPCFNEEKRILKKFDRVYKLLKSNIKSFEVILVNDGSKDYTESVLKKITSKYNNTRLLSYFPNKGKGFAVKKGVVEARGKVIGFTDADFAINLEPLPQVIKDILVNNIDIVIGNRKTSQSNLENKPDFIRRLFSFLHSRINNYFLNLGSVKDTLCGFKFFEKHIAKSLFSDLKIYRWFFDLEIIIKANLKKYRIKQQPVKWEEVQGGQVKIFDAIKTSLKEHFIIYTTFFNFKIYTFLVIGLTFFILIPFLLSPEGLTKRNGDWSDLVWPDYYFIRKSILEDKQIPLWNPTIFSGIPEIANPQSPLIYPLNFLTLILPLDIGIVFLIGLHVILSALFLYKLGKELLGWSNVSSIILSLGITFSPFYWSKFSIGHLSMAFAMLLVSPVLYFSFSLLKKFKISTFLILTIFLSLMYLNYPTIWYYTNFFGLLAVLLIFRSISKILIYLTVAIFSLVLIFPIFLIQLQAAEYITRSQLAISDLSIPIWSIKRFISSIIIPSNFSKDLETEVWMYPSIVLLTTAILGIIKAKRKYFITSIILLILVSLLTLGSRTPIFELFARFVPGFSYLRVSTRDWFIFIIIIAFFGAYFINKLSSRYQLILGSFIIFDLVFFSIFRFWSVPQVMQYKVNQDLNKLLINNVNDYRYYCTGRCLSARDTLPLSINSADGYHLLILKSYREELSKAGGFAPPKYTGNIPSTENYGAQPKSDEIGKFGVKYIISDYELADQNFNRTKQAGKYILYENEIARKRFYFENNLGEIEVLELKANSVILNVKTTNFDKLIIADSYYPGWEVKVNGEMVQLEKYQNWAKAINVKAGEHLIKLEFKPFNNLIIR